MDEAKRKALRTRLTIGPLLVAAILAVYWLDSGAGHGRISAAVLGILSVAGLAEYVAMMRGAGHPVSGAVIVPAAAGLHVAAFFFDWRPIDHELHPIVLMTGAVLLLISLQALTRQHMLHSLEVLGGSLLGLTLLVPPFYLAQGLALRSLPLLFFVVVVSKCADTGAYFAGIMFGRRKLIPHVSPGKTIEGAFGGLLLSVVVALLLQRPLLGAELPLTLTGLVVVAIMINVTTQVGDLVESLLKRRCNVKDSSRLLPVHGGVLDLTDSFLFSVPAFFFVVAFLS